MRVLRVIVIADACVNGGDARGSRFVPGSAQQRGCFCPCEGAKRCARNGWMRACVSLAEERRGFLCAEPECQRCLPLCSTTPDGEQRAKQWTALGGRRNVQLQRRRRRGGRQSGRAEGEQRAAPDGSVCMGTLAASFSLPSVPLHNPAAHQQATQSESLFSSPVSDMIGQFAPPPSHQKTPFAASVWSRRPSRCHPYLRASPPSSSPPQRQAMSPSRRQVVCRISKRKAKRVTVTSCDSCRLRKLKVGECCHHIDSVLTGPRLLSATQRICRWELHATSAASRVPSALLMIEMNYSLPSRSAHRSLSR